MIKKITPEMARIHAHICGDGCVYTKILKLSKRKLSRHKRINPYEKIWVMEYTNTENLLRQEFITDIKISFNRKSYNYSKYYRVTLTHCKWIIDFLELDNKNSYNWKIPKDILNSKRLSTHWLRAFFDDESTVTQKQKMIRIKSMNLYGLKQILFMLKNHGIYSKITGQNCDKSWYLNIYRNDLKQYEKQIGFLHPQKREKLNQILTGAARI